MWYGSDLLLKWSSTVWSRISMTGMRRQKRSQMSMYFILDRGRTLARLVSMVVTTNMACHYSGSLSPF